MFYKVTFISLLFACIKMVQEARFYSEINTFVKGQLTLPNQMCMHEVARHFFMPFFQVLLDTNKVWQ